MVLSPLILRALPHGARRLAVLLLLGLCTAPVVRAQDVQDAAEIRELLAGDRWVEALVAARAAHAAGPADTEVATALAESLFRAGALAECEALLETLVARESVPARALTTLARLRAAQGRRRDVPGLLTRALTQAADDREVAYWAGDLEVNRARAIELLERYLTLSEGDDPDRIESARGAVRFMRELGDRKVWVSESSPSRVELPLTQLWDAAGRTTGYVVEIFLGDKGEANGKRRKKSKQKPVRLLLDTGTSGVFLIDRIARKGGFEPLADKTLIGGGGDRRHAARRGVIPMLDLGGLRYSGALVTTTRQELDPTGRFHGLLGISIFGGYRVTLDLAGKRLILEESTGSPVGSPYWWVSGQLLTRASAGKADGLFVVDSGATDTVLADNLLASAGASRKQSEGKPVTVQAIGGAVGGARLVRGLGVDFHGLQSGDGILAIDLSLQSRLGGVEVSGLLGLDLLAKQRIVIDTTSQRIAINP